MAGISRAGTNGKGASTQSWREREAEQANENIRRGVALAAKKESEP
jgi:hypothetical protein